MPRNRIDVHTHYLGGAVARWFRSVNYIATGGIPMGDLSLWSPQAALEFMDRHEIATQILSVPIDFARNDDGAATARVTREINEDYATLITDHPGRFGAFTSLPLDSPDSALAEIEYGLDVLGLDGVILTSNASGHYFGQQFYEPILAELARRQIPVFVHPADCPHVDELGFGRPSSVVEFPFDTARTITNAIYTGVFQRHPGLTLILAHCGGALPTLGWRIAEHLSIARGRLDAVISAAEVATVLHGFYYETALAGSPNSLLPTLEVTDADHLLFGTDWPAAPEPVVDHNITSLTSFPGLSPAELTGVDRTNATLLFPRLTRSEAAHMTGTS